MNKVSPRYYRRFCVSGRAPDSCLSNVVLRAPLMGEHFTTVRPYVVLDEVWTARGARGMGYATQLIKAAQEEALRHGWAIMCRPHSHKDRARPQPKLVAFYERLGWAESSTLCWLSWAPGDNGVLRRAA